MYSMLKRMRQDFNVYIGTETGILKGVNVDHKAIVCKNFHNIQALERGHEITSMEWGNREQTEIVMALHNKTVRVFDIGSKIFTSSKELDVGDGRIISLGKSYESLITAVDSGLVTVWHKDGPRKVEAIGNVHNKLLCRMRVNPHSPNQIATAGREHNITIRDLEKPEKPVFVAKNLPPDMLQIPIPIWFSDLVFMDEPNIITAVTRHSHVRLFDTRAKRDPVINFEYMEAPFTTVAAVPNTRQVIAGTSQGRMYHFDFRSLSPHMSLGSLRGFAGAVRSIAVAPDLPVVFSVSLDRFLRVHDLKDHKLMYKEYLKSRLNHVLIRNDLSRSDLFPTDLDNWKPNQGSGKDSTEKTMIRRKHHIRKRPGALKRL